MNQSINKPAKKKQLLLKRRWPLWVLAGAVISSFLTLGRSAAKSAPTTLENWHHDYPAAIAQVAKTGKPLLVLFTADWCPSCTILKSEALSLPKVNEQLQAKFVLYKADVTTQKGFALEFGQKYQVEAIPTLIIFDTHQNEIARHVGAASPVDLLQWVNQSLASRKTIANVAKEGG